MAEKMRKFDRNAAFSMKLVNQESGQADAIYCTENLQGSLLCFLENSIATVLPAEVLDPHNNDPETRHSNQLIYSVGSRNIIVARTILQAKAILESVSLKGGFDKQVILDHVWDCSQHLIKCEKSYREIDFDKTKLLHKCDKIVEDAKKSSYVPSLPQINNLEQRVVSFLGNAKRFLEKSHELLSIFYNCDRLGSDFPQYRVQMKKNSSLKTEVINLLEQDKNWIQRLALYRNALDINHSGPDFKVEIENFKFCVGNKFSSPSWKYDFTKKKGGVQECPSDLIRDIEVFLANMLSFFEELFILCVKDNWDVRYGFEIYQCKEKNINEKCPMLYFASRK